MVLLLLEGDIVKKERVVFCVVLLLLFASTVSAETLFVVDRVVVSLRKQPVDNALVVGYLKSDQSVELLEDAEKYAKVRTDAGETGFVLRQYLTASEPKSTIIRELELERSQLLAQLQELKDRASRSGSENDKVLQTTNRQLRSVQQELAEARTALSKSEAEVRKLAKDYQFLKESSENIVQILTERDRLLEEKQELLEMSATFEAERDALLKKGGIKWFLAGGGVLLVGWMIGKSSGARRRSSLL